MLTNTDHFYFLEFCNCMLNIHDTTINLISREQRETKLPKYPTQGCKPAVHKMKKDKVKLSDFCLCSTQFKKTSGFKTTKDEQHRI